MGTGIRAIFVLTITTKTMTAQQRETKAYTNFLKENGVKIKKVENGTYTANYKGIEIEVQKLQGQLGWISDKGNEPYYSNKIEAIYWTMRTDLNLL